MQLANVNFLGIYQCYGHGILLLENGAKEDAISFHSVMNCFDAKPAIYFGAAGKKTQVNLKCKR